MNQLEIPTSGTLEDYNKIRYFKLNVSAEILCLIKSLKHTVTVASYRNGSLYHKLFHT